MQRSELVDLVLKQAADINETLTAQIPLDRGADAPLYGRDGSLDSLGLVSLLAAVEQAVEEEYGVTITLADERAVSQKHSPFRTVGSLADYVALLVSESAVR